MYLNITCKHVCLVPRMHIYVHIYVRVYVHAHITHTPSFATTLSFNSVCAKRPIYVKRDL